MQYDIIDTSVSGSNEDADKIGEDEVLALDCPEPKEKQPESDSDDESDVENGWIAYDSDSDDDSNAISIGDESSKNDIDSNDEALLAVMLTATWIQAGVSSFSW